MNQIVLFWSFFLIGFGSYGGGVVALSLIFNEIVSRRGWMTAEELSRFITLSQMTPGPIALNAATYTGFRLQGLPGALLATTAVIVPSIILLGCFLFFRERKLFPGLQDRLDGKRIVGALKPGILGLLVHAAYIFGRNAIVDPITIIIFLVSLSLFLFVPRLHPIVVVLAAGAAGVLLF